MKKERFKIGDLEGIVFNGDGVSLAGSQISLTEKRCEVVIHGAGWVDKPNEPVSLYDFINGPKLTGRREKSNPVFDMVCDLIRDRQRSKSQYTHNISLNLTLTLANWKKISRLVLKNNAVYEHEPLSEVVALLNITAVYGKWRRDFFMKCNKIGSNESFILCLHDPEWACSIIPGEGLKLLEAVESNDIKQVEAIIDALNPNAPIYWYHTWYIDTCVPLIKAVKINNFSMVKLLCEKGADVNMYAIGSGESALNVAMYNGKGDDFKLAKYLIEKGADLNHVAAWGVWPLGIAVRFSNFKLVKYLVKEGADVNQVCEDIDENETRSTALGIAVMDENIEMIKQLIQMGADPNADPGGMTPLEDAEALDNKEMIRTLLEAGAD